MVHSGLLAQNGHPQGVSIMNRVWETSSALFTAIGSKIKGLTGKVAPPPEDFERRAQRVMDSHKIQIRLMSNETDLASIRCIAETTDDAEIASYAVSYLVEHEDSLMLPHLQYLARTFSFACLPALISLFNKGETEIASNILAQRLRNGDYYYLIQNKKARPLLLLDVLGAVDEYMKTTLCLENFPIVWRTIADRPEDQEKLLAEILGDVNPSGLRYAPDANMIPQAVKIQALQLLHAIRPASYERSLWYATREKDDVVAYTATMACTDHWQHEGIKPEQLESFPMLDLNLLFYLSKLASAFQWSGPAGVLDLYTKWTKDMETLESIDSGLEPQRFHILRKQCETMREQLVDITEQRLNALQPIVDGVTNSLRLPHAKIRSTDVPGVAAAYLVGTGTVEFSKTTLLDDKPLTEEFMSSMLHELGHMEQDVLIIRMIADQIGLQFGQHGSKLKLLFQHYSDAIGYAPDSIFLLEVLRLRRDIPLTPDEKRRAERLLQAAYENVQASHKGKKVSDRMAHLEESVGALESGAYDWHLLDCLRDERSLQPMFENGYVPSILIDEMKTCRERIEELIAAMAEVSPEIVPRRGFGKPDYISIAQELFKEGQNEETPLSPIIERFRIVISHMLSEEYRRLDKQLSEIRRAGYHEAEAYTISDRVEVIVKALRKGWYEFV